MMETESRVARKLVNHFGGRKETEQAMDMNRETLRLWLLNGIPLGKALEVEERTDGAIKAEEIVREARSNKAAA